LCFSRFKSFVKLEGAVTNHAQHRLHPRTRSHNIEYTPEDASSHNPEDAFPTAPRMRPAAEWGVSTPLFI
jgi:hypothetical protein